MESICLSSDGQNSGQIAERPSTPFYAPLFLSCCLYPVLVLPLSAQLTLGTTSFKHHLMWDLAIEEQRDLLTPAVLSIAASGSVASGWLCCSWETWILIICSCQEQHKECSFLSLSTVSLNTSVQVPWKSLLAVSFGWSKISCDLYSASCELPWWYTERHSEFKTCTQHTLAGLVASLQLLYPLLPRHVQTVPWCMSLHRCS